MGNGLPHSLEASARALYEQALRDLATNPPRRPRATYRLQLGADFTLEDARRTLDYLAALGVGDLYLSPVLQARTGSSHGYDMVDPGSVDRALGGDAAFERFCADARALGLGVIVDVVPNHMGIGDERNAWWNDVLEHGPAAMSAGFFDIEWMPPKPELAGKLLLPILPVTYGEALTSGMLQVRWEHRRFVLHCSNQDLRLAPDTWGEVLALLPPGADEDHALESIVHGLERLPPRQTGLAPEPRRERRRESEQLRERLAGLLEGTEDRRAGLGSALAVLNGTPGEEGSFERLHALLERQSWRLAHWRVASEEVNYRRFFDINELAAIRMDDPEAFERTHRRVLELVERGLVTGLRIDHPDGLADPAGYFAALQQAAFVARAARLCTATGEERRALLAAVERLRAGEPARPRAIFVVAEKILASNERLPDDWEVDGTTGYDFAALATGLLLDAEGEGPLTRLWEAWSGTDETFQEVAFEAKELVLETSLASEFGRLEHMLERLAARDRHTRDFTHGPLTRALEAVIATFPVYRTYATRTSERLSDQDRAAVELALRRARRRRAPLEGAVFDLLRRVLLLDPPGDDAAGWREFVVRFQQVTAPVTAKGVEDTAFYRHHRLASLNEVGSDPSRFGLGPQAFLHAAETHAQRHPFGLLATSTHDTKRGEDVRARLGVLSELPAEWASTVDRASVNGAVHKTLLEGEPAPGERDEYLLYQTIVGTLPDEGPDEAYVARVVAYQRKAAREAKERTSWTNVDEAYEAALERFVVATLAPGAAYEALAQLARAAAFHGRWNALSQALLRLTCPGVPDTYQGSELWALTLVDPDNRRPVDFAVRERILREVRARRREGAAFARELVGSAADGRSKMLVTHAALDLRRRHPDLLDGRGGLVAVEARGARRSHVFAFLRSSPRARALIVVPRFPARLARGALHAPIGEAWGDEVLDVPPGDWRDAFTGETLRAAPGGLPLRSVLAHFPVALLESEPA